MGVTTFVLLLTVFLLLTAGTAAVVTLYKNVGRDMLKLFQIGETQLHDDLQKKQIKHYVVHND